MPTTADTRSETPETRLREYLRQRAADGEFYAKSKFIADDVGLSPSQVGVLLGELQRSMEDLEIDQWGYTNATTWRITPQTTAPD